MSSVIATQSPNSPQQNQFQSPPSGLSVDQQLALRTLQEQTRLTTNYAMQCLTQANWNIQQAIQLVQQNRHKLPGDAFYQ